MERIAIPVQTTVRELNGKIWLSLNLLNQGEYKIAIGHYREIHKLLDEIKPHVYFEQHLMDSSSELVERLNYFDRIGTKVCVLETEGTIHPSQEAFYNSRVSENLTKSVDKYFAWGEWSAEAILNNSETLDDEVVVTGNPRFDLLLPPLRNIYNESSKTLQKKYGDYILINTNFGRVNNRNDSRVESYKEKDFKYFTHKKELFNQFVELIGYISHNIEGKNIIVRPHPSENILTYEEMFDQQDNVLVRHSGNVRNWIMGAEMVIHNSCTTGVESAMLDVPVISYRPIKDSRYDVKLPNQVSREISSKENIVSALAEESHQSTDRDQIDIHFNNRRSKSVDLIINQVAELNSDVHGNFTEFRNMKELFRRLIYKSDVLHNIYSYRQSGSQKFPDLSTDEVVDRISQFSDYIDTRNITVEPVVENRNVFWLYRS